eukprot:1148269-Pelagomonas_calceolata.AAC.1
MGLIGGLIENQQANSNNLTLSAKCPGGNLAPVTLGKLGSKWRGWGDNLTRTKRKGQTRRITGHVPSPEGAMKEEGAGLRCSSSSGASC